MRIALMLLLASAAACSTDAGSTGLAPPPPAPRPTGTVVSLAFDPTEITIAAAHTALFTLTARDAAGQPVFGAGIPGYSSSAPSVATATNGTFSAHLPGVAVISATLRGVVAHATVTVVP